MEAMKNVLLQKSIQHKRPDGTDDPFHVASLSIFGVKNDLTPLLNVLGDALVLMDKKNTDYSGQVDNLTLTGEIGLATRLIDKLARFLSLVSKEGYEGAIKEESLRDTVMDALNYSLITLAKLSNVWPIAKLGEPEVHVTEQAQMGLPYDA